MKCNIGIVIILLSLSFASSRLGKTKNDNLMYLDSIKFQNQEVTFPSNEVAFDKGTISETGIKLIIKKTSIDKFPQQILSFFDKDQETQTSISYKLPLGTVKVVGKHLYAISRDELVLRVTKKDYLPPIEIIWVAQYGYGDKVHTLSKLIMQEGTNCKELVRTYKLEMLRDATEFIYYYYNTDIKDRGKENRKELQNKMVQGLERIKKCISRDSYQHLAFLLNKGTPEDFNSARAEVVGL